MTLQTLLLEELQDLYDAEQQLMAALPKLADASSSEALRAVLTSHCAETRAHIGRLEDTFALMGKRAGRRPCAGIAGILEEGARLLGVDIDGAVRDAGIIAGAQKAEHYEMCAYGTCVAWARALGQHQVAARLEETLLEEKAADEALNDLALQQVNISATHEAT
jgi:ferritin-like metal-binding protein YciE